MPRVYLSLVKATTHKVPWKAIILHTRLSLLPRRLLILRLIRLLILRLILLLILRLIPPPDTEADTPHDIEADTPSPDNVVDTPHDHAAHADTVSGPPSGIDPSVTMIPPQHQPYQVSCPPLPRPAKGGHIASFSLRALLLKDCCLPNLTISGLFDISLLDISANHFKKQKINETFSYGQINNISNNTTTTIKFRQCHFDP
jgi:hypothetical protein